MEGSSEARRFSPNFLDILRSQKCQVTKPKFNMAPTLWVRCWDIFGDRTWIVTTKIEAEIVLTSGVAIEGDPATVSESHTETCRLHTKTTGKLWKGWEKDMFFRCFLDDCHLQPLQLMFRCILAPAEPPNTEDPETSAAPWDCDSLTSNAGP